MIVCTRECVQKNLELLLSAPRRSNFCNIRPPTAIACFFFQSPCDIAQELLQNVGIGGFFLRGRSRNGVSGQTQDKSQLFRISEGFFLVRWGKNLKLAENKSGGNFSKKPFVSHTLRSLSVVSLRNLFSSSSREHVSQPRITAPIKRPGRRRSTVY